MYNLKLGVAMHHKRPFHIAFYVDGFTLKKVNTFYRKYHPFHSTLDFLGIKNWARDQALRLFDPPDGLPLLPPRQGSEKLRLYQ